MDDPVLVASSDALNVVRYAGHFWIVPQALGPVDLTSDDLRATLESFDTLDAATAGRGTFQAAIQPDMTVSQPGGPLDGSTITDVRGAGTTAENA